MPIIKQPDEERNILEKKFTELGILILKYFILKFSTCDALSFSSDARTKFDRTIPSRNTLSKEK